MTEVIKVEDCVKNIGDYDVLICNAIIVPKGATNGDMIKAMFPNVLIREVCRGELIEFTLDGVVGTSATKDWWNAPFISQK